MGTLEHRCITESIRSIHPGVDYHQSWCTHINVKESSLRLKSAITENCFKLYYDRLVIACGAQVNTFGIAGVEAHALFLKDTTDARRIRSRVLSCFEKAAHLNLNDPVLSRLLHFVIVGGGPTGVEFSAELHDFIADDLRKYFPSLVSLVRITIYDVATRILGGFDQRLAEYARDRFNRERIEIRTGTKVMAVHPEGISVQATDGRGEEFIECGLVVWATGLAPTPLTCELAVSKILKPIDC